MIKSGQGKKQLGKIENIGILIYFSQVQGWFQSANKNANIIYKFVTNYYKRII